MTSGIRLRFGAALLAAAAVMQAAPALAQVDLSGFWVRRGSDDNGYSREPVDLLGIPVSEDGRVKALSYDIAALSATERQCQMYTPWYMFTGPFALHISSEHDPITQKLVAWKIAGWIDKDATTIWMDGRPHPSKYAPHTHGGFTTGQWEGDTLTAYNTHFKMGDIKRHTSFSSDRATITYRFTRRGDMMTVTGILEDPVYLAEPYVLTEVFELAPDGSTIPLTACEPIEELPHLHENPGLVPHYLPGQNPWVDELTQNRNIPREAVLGGPATMYPEYRKTLRDKYVAPERCRVDCAAGGRGGAPPAGGRGAAPPAGGRGGTPPAGGRGAAPAQ